ncbi:MAG: GH3 auxin-responsive promoter family protein [Bdellovibrionales bacterium]|nr:GH3 auxin-responsive promoter family protein [Bdellovibrionales bacterium]
MNRDASLRLQERLLRQLISNSASTRFGREHGFSDLSKSFEYQKYKAQVPLRNYEDYSPYWAALAQGEADVLHPGFPDYFALSSGTSGGPKKIPLTRLQVRQGIRRTTWAFLRFLWSEKTVQPLTWKLMYLSAPAVLSNHSGRPTALLSALSHDQLKRSPLKSRTLPSWGANSDPDPQSRKKKIVDELLSEKISYFSGTPPWMLTILDECAKSSGRSIPELFPHLHCFGSGGTAMDPYRPQFESRFPGRKLIFFETFTATEGVIGSRESSNAQDYLLDPEMLVFEFVPYQDGKIQGSGRCLLADAVTGQDYALAISNPSGLFSYLLGDVIRLTSTDPFRFEVRGRTENFLNRYGEHLLGSELERVMQTVRVQSGQKITEFTVFDQPSGYTLCVEGPEGMDLEKIVQLFDQELSNGNPLLRNARRGDVASAWKIHRLNEGFLSQFFLAQGRVYGQSKIPRIISRTVEAEALMKAIIR